MKMSKIKSLYAIILILILIFTNVTIWSFDTSAATSTALSVDRRYITLGLGKKTTIAVFVPNELAVNNKLAYECSSGLHADLAIDGHMIDNGINNKTKIAGVRITAIKEGKHKIRIYEEKTNRSVIVKVTVYDGRKRSNNKKDSSTGISVDVPNLTMSVGEKTKIYYIVSKEWFKDEDAFIKILNYNNNGIYYTSPNAFYPSDDKTLYYGEIRVTALSKGHKKAKIIDSKSKKSVIIHITVE